MGWRGMPYVDFGLPQSAIRTVRSGSADRTQPQYGCPITSSTAGPRFGTASLVNTAQTPSTPPLPLHHSTVTDLVNLYRQETHSRSHHQLHIP